MNVKSRRRKTARSPVTDPSRNFESLEQRAMFSAAYAAVGMGYDFDAGANNSGYVFTVSGTVDNGQLSGSSRTDSGGQWGPGRAVATRTVGWGPHARFTSDPAAFASPATAISAEGAQFLQTRGFPVGWQLAHFSKGAGVDQELTLLTELPTDAKASDLNGSWLFSIKAYYSDSMFHHQVVNSIATATVKDGSMTFTWQGEELSDTRAVVITSGGTVTASGTSRTFYLSKDRSVMLVASPGEVAGLSMFGIGVRAKATVSTSEASGDYRVALGLGEDLNARDVPLSAIGYRDGVLRINKNGSFALLDTNQYDAGKEVTTESGFWSVAKGVITLVRSSDDSSILCRLSESGQTLVALSDDNEAGVMLVGTRTIAGPSAGDGGDVVYSVPGSDPAGNPAIWELASDGVWRHIDLRSRAGGSAITGDIVTWTGSSDNLSYAAAVTTQGLNVYRHDRSGVWTVLDLSKLGGAEPIAGSLSAMTSPTDGRVHLTGSNTAGQVLDYSGDGNGENWTFTNLATSDLLPSGQVVPVFAGPTLSYATSWGGLNVAGLDSAGHIWSIWWAPGREKWSSVDLSVITQAEPLTGGLTVYLTGWNGINLAGIAADGTLRVTWWVPAFGAEWRQSDLTAIFNGPRLDPSTISSYVSSWGGLNITGLDAKTGDVKVYWWSPARGDGNWSVTSLTDIVGASAPRLVRDIRGIAARDDSLNVVALDSSDHLIRYYWRPSFGGSWLAQDVSLESIPG